MLWHAPPPGSMSLKMRYVLSTSRSLERIAYPVFMSMTYTDHENWSALLDPVDNWMGLERMNSDWWRNLFSLTCHSGVGGNEIKHSEQIVMISPRLCGSEHAYTLFGDRDDVIFRFNRKPEMH